jgi:hypothetical protein
MQWAADLTPARSAFSTAASQIRRAWVSMASFDSVTSIIGTPTSVAAAIWNPVVTL